MRFASRYARLSSIPMFALAIAVLLSATASTLSAQTAAKSFDWPQYQGPNRDGISAETGWSADWGKEGPKKLWEISVGEGYSCVSTSNGRAYTMGNAKDTDTVFCLDALTGKEIWKKTYPCKGGSYPGPRCSPTIDGDRVYTLSIEGHLNCWDAASGKVIWSKKASDLGGKSGGWGYACSPLVLGDALIVDVGVTAALNKTTGEVLWKTPAYTPGYSSPKAFKSGEKTLLAIFNGDGLMVLNAADGKQIGQTFPWKTSYDVNATTPIFSDEMLFITSDYGHGSALLKVGADGLTKVWENKELASQFATPILLDGSLYSSSGAVGQGPFKCVEFKSGTVKWTQKVNGSQILAGGKLIVLETGGRLVVVDPSPAEYKEIASTNVGKGSWWNAPVLSNGLIYCRSHEGTLICLDVRK